MKLKIFASELIKTFKTMKKVNFLTVILFMLIVTAACEKDSEVTLETQNEKEKVPLALLESLKAKGYDIETNVPYIKDDYIIVAGDIRMLVKDL